MVVAAGVNASQVFALVGATGVASNVEASQTYALVAAAYPSQSLESSQVFVNVAAASTNTIRASQVWTMVAAIGAISDPALRVWTFTLDGHDYYVLRLGNDRTLVYDNLTKQWYNWGSGTSPLWATYSGTVWQGADKIAGAYGSNVVVGSDSNGSLYFLTTDQDTDDPAVDGAGQVEFERVAYAQIPLHGYDRQRCFGATVWGSNGETSSTTDLTIKLEYSDDNGHNYIIPAAQTMTDATTRITWRGLGSMKYPGRLFRVLDYGAFQRLDSIDVLDEQK